MAGDTYTVSRSLTMHAPPERVYDQIADFRRWPGWSPWEDLDPDMKRVYSGADSGVGAAYAWSGNRRAGQGRMQITDSQPHSKIRIDLVFDKPWKARSDTLFTIEPVGSGSNVTWSMTGEQTLMTKAMGIIKSMDKMIGPDFDKGLARLRAVTEQTAED
jgi:Polyketide cyclase / dehydrase and lipid transport